MHGLRIERLTVADVDRARELFLLMAEVFETEAEPLGAEYLERLLGRPDFWAFAASVEGTTVGGLTAHTLPLTRIAASEVLIYDIAVASAFQRRGIGRHLVTALREQVSALGISVAWVAADSEDTHALDFYRNLGGTPAPVTIFTFSGDSGN